MDKNLFEEIDPLVDEISEEIGQLIDGEALNKLKQQLADLSTKLGDYSVTLEMNVQVFDAERENALPLLQTGLATSDGKPPYQAWGDSTPHRYIANGEMTIVPHDFCPICWAIWAAKETHPTCDSCGAEMGENVKLLLDSDCCPNCEKGKVTASQPQCSECGFAVNPDHVVWG